MEDYDSYIAQSDRGENGVIVASRACPRDEFRPRGGKVLSRVAAVAAARNGSSTSSYDIAVTRNIKKKQKTKLVSACYEAFRLTDNIKFIRITTREFPPVSMT